MQFDEQKMKIILYDDYPDKIEIPGKYIVCPRCEGRGSHTNPSIDGNGLSREDFDEMGPQSEEDYFAGVYDVVCHECKGKKVIMIVDKNKATKEELKEYSEYIDSMNSIDRMQEAERRMGA